MSAADIHPVSPTVLAGFKVEDRPIASSEKQLLISQWWQVAELILLDMTVKFEDGKECWTNTWCPHVIGYTCLYWNAVVMKSSAVT